MKKFNSINGWIKIIGLSCFMILSINSIQCQTQLDSLSESELKQLPALLYTNAVGVTIPQAESITYLQFLYDDERVQSRIYKDGFIESQKSNGILKQINENLENELVKSQRIINISDMELQQAWSNCREIQKQLDKQKRKNTFTVITGSLIAGGLIALWISK